MLEFNEETCAELVLEREEQIVEIEKLNFALKVTKVGCKSIDRIIKLADSDIENNYLKLASSMVGKEEDFNTEAFLAVADAQKFAFSLYALAIVHCYSILENNRKLICQHISGITNKQKYGLHKIEIVDECLKSISVKHEKIKCYKTMDEFRLVNNAIKHDRYNLSTCVTTKNHKKYDSKALKSLYSNRARHLETYLADLYQRIMV